MKTSLANLIEVGKAFNYREKSMVFRRAPRSGRPSPLLRLPRELIGYILTKLPVEDHISCLQVSALLHEVGSEQWVWCQRYCTDFQDGSSSVTHPASNWKHAYIERYCYWALQVPQRIKATHPSPYSTNVFDVDYDGGSLVVSTWSNGAVRLWDLPSSHHDEVLASPHIQIYTCVLDPDSGLVYCGAAKGTCLVLCPRRKSFVDRIKVLDETDSVFNVMKSPFGIVFAGSTGALALLTSSGALLSINNAHSSAIIGFAYSEKHQALITSSSNNRVKMWRWSNSRSKLVCCSKYTLEMDGFDISALAVHNDSIVVGGHGDGAIREFNIMNGDVEAHRYIGHDRMVRTIHIEGRYMVSGSYDGTVRMWDLKSKKLLHTIGDSSAGSSWVLAARIKNRKIVFGAGSECNLLEFA